MIRCVMKKKHFFFFFSMTSSITREQGLWLGEFRKSTVHILKIKEKIFDYPKCRVVARFPRLFHRYNFHQMSKHLYEFYMIGAETYL